MKKAKKRAKRKTKKKIAKEKSKQIVGETPDYSLSRFLCMMRKKFAQHPPALEDFAFAFLVTLSLLLLLICVVGVAAIPSEFPQQARAEGPSKMERNIKKMSRGFPLEKMSPYIAKKDKKVAAFLVAIAKKESNWGVHAPKKNGKECYNYWGYRGPENPTESGYSCFSSPRQAVNVVGRRIKNLMAEKIDTPREMVMWKCGSACTRRGARGEAKWVRDVGFYYEKIM